MPNRRSVSRYLFGVAAKLSDSENPAGLDVRVVNISSVGCCVETAAPLSVRERRVLIIGWRGAEIRAEVAVIWTDSPVGAERAGLSFRWVRPQDQPTLHELCSLLTLQPDSDYALDEPCEPGTGQQAA